MKFAAAQAAQKANVFLSVCVDTFAAAQAAQKAVLSRKKGNI